MSLSPFGIVSALTDRLRALPTRKEREAEKRLLLSLQEDLHHLADAQRLQVGRLLARQMSSLNPIRELRDAEFQVFSQWGDDGIIHYLTTTLAPTSRTFVEFGVSDYRESNTRFLLMDKNWSGFVIDGSKVNIERIRNWNQFWRFDLETVSAFVDRDNINALVATSGFPRDTGLLHIDIDGNDYWLWQALNVIAPVIVIVEYNAIFGSERCITIPYTPLFDRTRAHSSNLYCGASLPALCRLAQQKQYAFVGCNSNGNNAYFVRRDCLSTGLKELTIAEGFVNSRFRESRSRDGSLSFLRGSERAAAIRGMPVQNIETGEMEPF
jgi:hypothetical protein